MFYPHTVNPGQVFPLPSPSSHIHTPFHSWRNPLLVFLPLGLVLLSLEFQCRFRPGFTPLGKIVAAVPSQSESRPGFVPFPLPEATVFLPVHSCCGSIPHFPSWRPISAPLHPTHDPGRVFSLLLPFLDGSIPDFTPPGLCFTC